MLDRSMMLTIYREATPIMLLTVIAEIGAGVMLTRIEEFYKLLPGLFIMLPGLMEAKGNISGALGQRLGSAIHLGLVSWELGFNDEVRENVKASISLGLIISVVLGFLAFISSVVLGFRHMTVLGFIIIAVLTSFIAGVTQSLLTVLIATYSPELGLDPDNVTIPILSAIGDILIVLYLLLVARFTWFLSGWLPII